MRSEANVVSITQHVTRSTTPPARFMNTTGMSVANSSSRNTGPKAQYEYKIIFVYK